MGEKKFATQLIRIGLLTAFVLASWNVDAQEIATLSSRIPPIRVRQRSDLEILEARAKVAVKKALSATVSVQVGRGARGGYAFGSGVIVSDDGYVLTAAHVSSRPNQSVIFRFNDGTRANGVTLGLHKELDMGLMRITDQGPWPHLKRARSSNVEAGDWVIATGYPGGFDQESPSAVRLGRILKATSKVLLTDCTLVGGDSGGPLVDINGYVIGVHSRIGADLTTNLHVPIDRFAENWERLANRDVWGLLESERPWIGVDHNEKFTEAVIQEVNHAGPAIRAGLRSGDVVVRFDGQEIESFSKLRRLVAKQDPGAQVAIQYKRNDLLYETMMDIGKKKSHADSQTRDDKELLEDWLEQIDLRRKYGRAIVGIGKNADQVKESFHDSLVSASRATVEVIDSANVVAYGTIIDDRLILTKASELQGKNLRCRYRHSKSFAVEKIAELRSHDLALLKASKPLPKPGLKTAPAPEPGSLLASSGLNVWPLAVGVVSTGVLRIPSEGKLGIRMKGVEPLVAELIPHSGAETAGVRTNDLITAVDGNAISTSRELIDIVTNSFPGDVLTLTIQRTDTMLEMPVELLRYSEFDEALAEFEDFIGGDLSDRKTGFESVLQHDTAIQPQHCGGPVVDVHGRFVGINIARAARTSSYLLPAAEVKLAVDRLKELRTDKLITVDVGAVNK